MSPTHEATRARMASRSAGLSTIVSVVTHGAVIAAAILATARAGHTRPAAEVVHPVRYYLPPAPAGAQDSRAAGHQTGGATGAQIPGLPPARTTVDIATPTSIDPGVHPDMGWGAATSLVTGPRGSGGEGPAGPASPATEDMVDVPARPLPGTPPPDYPPTMRDAGITAHLTVQFIVDTSGRATPPTVLSADVDGAPRAAFLSAIRTSLAHTHFRPATIGGRAVRQLVQQEFDFVQLR
jgi:hypothetical protein